MVPISANPTGSDTGLDFARIHFDETGSTNDDAVRLALAGRRLPFWVTAARQTAGRGRRGRSWVSEPGNLYASLAWPAELLPAEIGRLPLVAAVAVRDTVARHADPRTVVTIKWPNDVLADGGKIAGVLIEQHGSGSRHFVVIGIGINIVTRPELSDYAAARLADFGCADGPDAVWRSLAAALAAAIGRWRGEGGFSDIRRSWLDHAAGLGEKISVTGSAGMETGTFADLDEQGFLILEQETGTKRISAGDVILSRSGARP